MKSKHLSPSPCFKSFIPSLHWQSYGYWLRYLQHKGILITHACTQPYIPDELGWKKSKSIRCGRTSEPPQKHANKHSKKVLRRAMDMGGWMTWKGHGDMEIKAEKKIYIYKMRTSSASVWDGQSGVFTGLTEWRMCGQVLLWCSCPFSKSAFTVVTWPTHGHTSPVSPLHDVRKKKKKTHTRTHRQTHTHPYCIMSLT